LFTQAHQVEYNVTKAGSIKLEHKYKYAYTLREEAGQGELIQGVLNPLIKLRIQSTNLGAYQGL
jgi:hypothetical protein